MINGSNDFSYVYESNKNAANFIDLDKKNDVPLTFSTAYGPRIQRQLPFVLRELQNDKDSRRGIIKILFHDDLENFIDKETKVEYPCSSYFQFMIRDNKLNMYTSMRSNNMCKTIVFDVYNCTFLQEFLLNELKKTYPDLKMGKYHHHIVSAHFFNNEQELVNKILNSSEIGIAMLK